MLGRTSSSAFQNPIAPSPTAISGGIGIITQIDRTVLAGYRQAYGRWVEAERKFAGSPPLLKTPAGYVQQSAWLAISNKQTELMAKNKSELVLTPSPRSRLAMMVPSGPKPRER